MFDWPGTTLHVASAQQDRVHRFAGFQNREAMFVKGSVEEIGVCEGQNAFQLGAIVEPEFCLVYEREQVFEANVVINRAEAFERKLFTGAGLDNEQEGFLGFFEQLF